MSDNVKQPRSVLVVGDDPSVSKMFLDRGYTVSLFSRDGQSLIAREKEFDGRSLVVFTGGADVCPFLYGELPLEGTRYDITRDMREIKLYKQIPWEVPKIGICRGAQFLNVMSGGSMWQHVNGHLVNHPIVTCANKTEPSRTLMISSTHHQMMIPSPDADVLASGCEATIFKSELLDRSIDKPGSDPEVIYYWTTNSLCFQPHPEYGPAECTRYFFHLIESYFTAAQDAKGVRS